MITWWAVELYFHDSTTYVLTPKRTKKEAHKEGKKCLFSLHLRGFKIIKLREVKK